MELTNYPNQMDLRVNENLFNYHVDEERLDYAIDLFKNVVSARSAQRGLPVRFDNGYLKSTEGYKSKVYVNGRKALAFETWKKSEIGSGKIIQRVANAFAQSKDIVYKYTPKDDPASYVRNTTLHEVENTVYSLYLDPEADEESVFERLMIIFGNKYNRIAYLFFLKDSDRFLPCKQTLFFDRFRELHIQTDCLTGISWGQYLEFNQIMEDIRCRISKNWDTPVTLLNAFSFAEQLSIIKEFLYNDEAYRIFLDNLADINYSKDEEANGEEKATEVEETLSYDVEEEQAKTMSDIELYRKAMERSQKPAKRKPTLVPQYYRDSYVKEIAKRRAWGVCTFCGQTLDYLDSEGRPYLESHHIVPLNEGGADSYENVAALCPNCHMRMHHTNDKSIVEFLKQKVKEQCKKEQDDIAINSIDEKLWESRDVDSTE